MPSVSLRYVTAQQVPAEKATAGLGDSKPRPLDIQRPGQRSEPLDNTRYQQAFQYTSASFATGHYHSPGAPVITSVSAPIGAKLMTVSSGD